MTTLVAVVCMVLAVPLLWLLWNVFLLPWRVVYHRQREKEAEAAGFTPEMKAELWAQLERGWDKRDEQED